MDIAVLTEYFTEYGPIIIFLIVFLEYLNLPGLPSGIIMPLAGIWAYSGIISLTSTIVISLIAGLAGSWGLYFIGKYGGDFIIKKVYK
ncbi:DedA protein [Clostridium polynesiense]|uniref:DedA family protein n=1 Tax=Clostridium polynesiense TaxID=1325933 RepID=UPI000ABE3406